ncbi:MAG TPA: DUF3638 domain-containing protein, partial [Waddliaceae bacterium]
DEELSKETPIQEKPFKEILTQKGEDPKETLVQETELPPKETIIQKEEPKEKPQEVKTPEDIPIPSSPNQAKKESTSPQGEKPPIQADKQPKQPFQRMSFDEKSDYIPDVPILQYFLADFVGGGKGNQLNNAIIFFKHYLEKYCNAIPKDSIAQKIQTYLSYYYDVPLNQSLQEVTQELFQKLETNKYVAFRGGRYDSDGGHAMFYELFLDEKKNVVFKVTNSGEGLEYHPKYYKKYSENPIRDYRYRTLVFSGITLDKLKKDSFMETILSFARPRSPTEELKGLVNFPQSTHTNISDLYRFLFYTWRGDRSILAENPGGPQRANSCSVYALMKWVKGSYSSDPSAQNNHLFMNFWIKASALGDYLNNEKAPSSSFISDALRKMSSHTSKMEALGMKADGWYQAWIELSKKAKEVIIQAKKRESEELCNQSIRFPDNGIDLSQVSSVSLKKSAKIDDLAEPTSKFDYTHRLPGEKPNYQQLPQLSLSYTNSLMNESVFRLNFFRLLPDFNKFSFEEDVLPTLQGDGTYDRTQFFTDLAETTKKFFYTSGPLDTIHIPDSFFPDLLNAWMISYLEAKASIPPEVLLEWIDGMILLTNSYSSEYTFDKPEARHRFNSIEEYCKQEQKELLAKLGTDYKRPTVQYWEIHDYPLEDPEHYSTEYTDWCPFGVHWWKKTDKKKPRVEKREELPESANFAFQHMNFLVPQPVEEKSSEITKKALNTAKWINRRFSSHDENIQKGDIRKAVAMFGQKLPLVPFFDSLRESLASLYMFADRYLHKNSSFHGVRFGDEPSIFDSLIEITPQKEDLSKGGSCIKPSIGSKDTLKSRRPNVTGKPSDDPEFYLPKTEKAGSDLKDFNERIHITFAKQDADFTKKSELPFFKENEQQEFVAFVQKDYTTRFLEYLTFCKKNIVQLALPAYQKTFEHVFFNLAGGLQVEELFKNPNDPLSHGCTELLFDFITHGTKELLSKNTKQKGGAAFLLQIHFRLYFMAVHYNHPSAKIYQNQLFEHWNQLIEEAKKQPAIAKTLGEATSKAMPVIESTNTIYKDSRFLHCLACTWLLECCQETSVKTSCDEITLNYAYQACKSLMVRSDHSEEIWINAASEVLNTNIHSCQWDPEKGNLVINNHFSIDLAAREVQRNDDTQLQLLPKDIADYDFKKFFGEKRPLCKVKNEGYFSIYSFRKQQQNYEVWYNKITEEKQIRRRIGQNHYTLSKSDETNDLELPNCFRQNICFWKDEKFSKIFIENKKSGTIIAVQENGEIYQLKNGERSKKVLGKFNNQDDTLKSLVTRIENPNEILIWSNCESKLISHIELPRLGIKLVASKKGDKPSLSCPSYPGFYVSQSQYVDFLKNYEGYLVLENSKGQKKILVPIQDTSSQKYEPFSLNPISAKGAPQGLIAYDIDIDQQEPELIPAPNQTQAITMLLFIYVSTEQYQKALDLIQKTSITSKKRLDVVSSTIVEWIIDHKASLNVHPYAVALRMHMYGWQPSLSKYRGRSHYVEKDLSLYEDLYHSLNRYGLDPKKIIEIQNNFQIHNCTTFCSQKGIGGELKFESSKFNIDALLVLREKIGAYDPYSQPKDPSSFANIGEDFILNFLPYYRIAKEGKPSNELTILKRLLLAADTEKDEIIAVLRNLLASAVIDPVNAATIAEMQELFKNPMNETNFVEEFKRIGNKTNDIFSKKKTTYISTWLSEGKEAFIGLEKGEKRTIHPAPRRADVPFQTLPPIKMSDPTKVYSIDKIESTILEEKVVSFTQDKESGGKLEEWGKKLAAAFKEKPVISAQFERIADGAGQYRGELDKKALKGHVLTHDVKKIEETCEKYKVVIEDSKKEVEALKNEIIEMANDTHGDIALFFEYLRDLRSPIDMEYLLIALGRGDKSAVKNGNPTLSDEKIEELMTKTGTYALMLTEQQKLVRCQTKLNDYLTLLKEGRKEELAQISLEYVETRNAERVFNPSDSPHYLVFEALSDLLIKKEQLKGLEDLTDPAQGWMLFEACTGFGKSKVLMPLWLILMSNAKNLTVAIAPLTLFDQSNDYLQKLLQKGYHFFGERIDFSRDSECTKEDIQEIEQALRQAKENRRPVFMSDQTAHQLFVLKVKELAAQKTSGDNYAALEALLKLRAYVKENGILFIDEPHKVLDDSQESNYSLGSSAAMEEWRLLFSLQLFESFFSLLKDKYRVEFSEEGKGLPLLTEEIYRKEVLPRLLDLFIEKIGIEDKKALSYLEGTLNQEEQELFEKELAGWKNGENAAKVRVFHDQLHHYLPQTLKKNSGEHYALVDEMEERSAIPLEDARNPKKGNEFCSADQIINFTIQANLKIPFSYEYVAHYLEELSLQAAAEM